MKFGKSLGRNIEDIPSGWRPFVIQYKSLKKCIHKIVQELDDKGISQDVRAAMLDVAEGYKMELSHEANPFHIRSYIELDLDTYPNTLSSHLLTEFYLKDNVQTDLMKYNSDSVSSSLSLPSTDSSDTESTLDPHDESETNSIHNNNFAIDQSHKTMCIELEADGEFFDTLLKEMSQLNHLQQRNKDEYMGKVDKLDNDLIDVTSPYKKDIYTWREIFQLYLQAKIFIGNTESDRNERDWENAQKQFKWFVSELSKKKLSCKLKSNSSKKAFQEFLRINNDLLDMKLFQCLNQTAISKILKKHDKQTCLVAGPKFGKFLGNDSYFTESMSKSLCYVMNEHLLTIIPQVEDHTCPICTSIYWKPIRLCCGHVFCVRCIIKVERKGMRNCPICRFTDAVYKADSSNLDIPLQNFIKLYFPREVDAKRTENGKEEAREDMEVFMGNGSECQIM